MATTLALRFLPFLLFFFMNDHGIGASRDLKVELQEKKEVESVGSTPISGDEPYGAGYKSTAHEVNRVGYTGYGAGYKSTAQEANQAGYTGYSVAYKSPDNEANQAGYGAGYKSTAQQANQGGYISYSVAYKSPSHEANQAGYHPGYKSTTHEANQAGYGAGYKSTAQEANQAGYTGYSVAYKSSDHEANQAGYGAGYKSTVQQANQGGYISYSVAYKSPSHEANQAGYHAGYKSTAHEANQAGYGAGYKSTAHEVNRVGYTGYGLGYKSPSHEANKADYGAGYKSTAQEANQASYTGYNVAYKSPSHEANQAGYTGYNVAYKSPSHEANQAGYPAGYKSPAHESNQAGYKAGYKSSVRVSKQDSKELTQGYDANYKTKLKESKGVPSSNVDHTEAFEKGMFILDDLYVGNVMTLQFPVQELSHFLPRKEADSIPFSTSQLSSALQLFSISEDSPLAQSMRGTLEQCEAETVTGETKICASSLESMLEFVGTILGSEAKYDIVTTSHPTPSAIPLQKYTILEVSQDIYSPKWVACHPLPYPYAVYYCHFIATGSKVFKVFLSGENGDKMEALGICHLDTSDWSPDQSAFRMFGMKPGDAPVCHFIPVKHLMWVPQPSTATK